MICGGLSLLGKGGALPGMDAEKSSLFALSNSAIEQGDFDMIALGRQSFADPALPAKYAAGKEQDIHWCTCCNRCGTLLGRQAHAGCAVYDPYYRTVYHDLTTK